MSQTWVYIFKCIHLFIDYKMFSFYVKQLWIIHNYNNIKTTTSYTDTTTKHATLVFDEHNNITELENILNQIY